jgi:hypothetical protein
MWNRWRSRPPCTAHRPPCLFVSSRACYFGTWLRTASMRAAKPHVRANGRSFGETKRAPTRCIVLESSPDPVRPCTAHSRGCSALISRRFVRLYRFVHRRRAECGELAQDPLHTRFGAPERSRFIAAIFPANPSFRIRRGRARCSRGRWWQASAGGCPARAGSHCDATTRTSGRAHAGVRASR